MEHSIRELARLSGVSSRTLRYYDEIGLLRPSRTSDAGYRFYGAREVDLLQQILFYRALGLPLERIRAIVQDPAFDAGAALRRHREGLLEQRRTLDTLIATVDKTIAAHERSIPMKDQDKFAGFKQALVDENEARHGAEVRARWGDEAADASNRRLLDMDEDAFAQTKALEQQVLDALDEAWAAGDAAGPLAARLAELHREWLCRHWEQYSPEAHAGLARMYVDDGRFAAYYDRGTPGKAAFLRDAILRMTGEQ